MTSHCPLIKLGFNRRFLITLNFLTTRWLCVHSFPQWLLKGWMYKWKLTVKLRLQGSIFIPLQWFLIRFAPFTRTVIIFLAATWADFIWNLEFKLCPLCTHFPYRKAESKKNKTKPSSKETVENKSCVPVFVLTWKFLTKMFWIWAEPPCKLLLTFWRLKTLKQKAEKWPWKMLS